MVERIRDVTVAEAIAAEAGTDATPELVLGENVTPVIILQPRPPLAISGYLCGLVGVASGASALNTSHVGIFGRGFPTGPVIVRVNYIMITNTAGAQRTFRIFREDSPFTGFPSVAAVTGYINAGANPSGSVFSVTKNDDPAQEGDLIGEITIGDTPDPVRIPGPFILNDGILGVSATAINNTVRAVFGYEAWPAIRTQPPA